MLRGIELRSHIHHDRLQRGFSAFKEFDHLTHMAHPINIQVVHHPRFTRIGLWNDQPLESVAPRLYRDRQGTLDGSNLAFQTQFAHQEVILQPLPVAYLLRSSQNPHRYRQIECRPTLTDIGRRQVYNDLGTGHFIPIRPDGALDPLDTLLHRTVRQSYNKVVPATCIPVHFHRDRQGFHPKHRTSKRLYEHDTKVQARKRVPR